MATPITPLPPHKHTHMRARAFSLSRQTWNTERSPRWSRGARGLIHRGGVKARDLSSLGKVFNSEHPDMSTSYLSLQEAVLFITTSAASAAFRFSSCVSFSLPAFAAASLACMPVACGVGRGVREDEEASDGMFFWAYTYRRALPPGELPMHPGAGTGRNAQARGGTHLLVALAALGASAHSPTRPTALGGRTVAAAPKRIVARAHIRRRRMARDSHAARLAFVLRHRALTPPAARKRLAVRQNYVRSAQVDKCRTARNRKIVLRSKNENQTAI